jgi:hypothetical protein
VNLREEPIRSQKYLAGSRGQPCTFCGPTCCADEATTVPAHMNGAAFGKGLGQKAHDIAVLDACFTCHAYIDVGHGTKPLMSDADFYWHLLRGVVLTMVNRARRKIVMVPLDPERLSSERQVSPRKPPSERKPVPNNPDRKLRSKSEWPTGRKLQSRKRETT